MEDVVAYLIDYTYTLNALKQEVKHETKTMIYARKNSINRAEYRVGEWVNRGGQSGFRPVFMLETAKIDYHGESEVEVDGKRYGIYRTYPKENDYIELYCQEKEGVSNG